ncbi:hypothetical protein CCP3SC1_1360001 [Gammaproteobacteria bacterium]
MLLRFSRAWTGITNRYSLVCCMKPWADILADVPKPVRRLPGSLIATLSMHSGIEGGHSVTRVAFLAGDGNRIA